jgi:hypothetical protein
MSYRGIISLMAHCYTFIVLCNVLLLYYCSSCLGIVLLYFTTNYYSIIVLCNMLLWSYCTLRRILQYYCTVQHVTVVLLYLDTDITVLLYCTTCYRYIIVLRVVTVELLYFTTNCYSITLMCNMLLLYYCTLRRILQYYSIV